MKGWFGLDVNLSRGRGSTSFVEFGNHGSDGLRDAVSRRALEDGMCEVPPCGKSSPINLSCGLMIA